MKRFILFFFLFFIMPAAVQAEEPMKCLLVSIEKYDIAPLDYAENDVGKLANILMSRYGCQAQACIDKAASDSDVRPDSPKLSIMAKIETWCKSLHKDDTAILYLAGHGVKDEEGKLYLAMTNFDRKNFDIAAIPLAWIRDQLGAVQCANKLLLIDTCFAGTSKSVDFENAGSDEVSGAFSDLEDVVTIASCRGNEKSWLWGDEKHSLFTYWLIEAFKGHADSDNDRVLTCEELVEYLQTNVSWIARAVLEKDQNPIVLNQQAGKNHRFRLMAISLKRLIDDVAEQIDLQMRVEKFSQVGVPEFTSGDSGTFDPRYGGLPKWITEEVRKALSQKNRKNRSGYSVLSENATRELLQSKGITPNDLGTEKTKHLAVAGKDIPLLVNGKVVLFDASGLTLRAQLLDTHAKSDVAEAGGTAILSPGDLALTGISGKFSIADRPMPSVNQALREIPGVGLATPRQQQEASAVLAAADRPHPLSTPVVSAQANEKFEVWIETHRKGTNQKFVRRDFVFHGNDCYLPLNKGEEYRICLRATSGTDTFVRVLVDGLNTLSQPQTAVNKGAYVEAVESERGEQVVAPCVALEDARAWVIRKNTPQFRAIQGFYNVQEKTDTVRLFEIVDADQSVAARRNYTDQVGLITVAFYRAASSSSPTHRGVGTGAGEARSTVVTRYKGDHRPGDMVALYSIRYVTPQRLREIQGQ